MPPQRQTGSKSNRDNEIEPGYFVCDRCGHKGKSAKGGLNKHLKNSRKCKGITSKRIRSKNKVPEAEVLEDSIESFALDDPIPESMDLEEEAINEEDISSYEAPEQEVDGAELVAEDSTPELPPLPEPKVTVSSEPPPLTLGPCDLYIQTHPFTRSLPPVASSIKVDLSPPSLYWPFKTFKDFRQAEIFLKGKASDETIDAQLAFDRSIKGENAELTLRDAKDMKRTLAKATFDEDKFQEHTITTTYGGRCYHHTFTFRNFLAAIRETLKQPCFDGLLTFDAERHYIARPGGGIMRSYQEYHQGDDLWDLQTTIGPLSSPLPIFVYADETQLTQFGNVTVWPVYFWLGCLPQRVRAAHSNGGATLVGFLPKANVPSHLRDEHIANFRCQLYHDCFKALLSSIEDASIHGDCFLLGNGEIKHCITVISLKIADLPELQKMERNVGQALKGGFGCPICMCPNDELSIVGRTWPTRDSRLASRSVENAIKGLVADENDIPRPRTLGLRPVISAFDTCCNYWFDSHRAIGADKLHLWLQGIFGRVWLLALQDKMTGSERKKLDEEFKRLPRYPNVAHFAKGVFGIKTRTGSDHAWISKMITPILDLVLSSRTELRSDLLVFFRHLGVMTVLLGLSTQSDATIELIESALTEFDRLERVWHAV